jgi:uncharacterized membrane protein
MQVRFEMLKKRFVPEQKPYIPLSQMEIFLEIAAAMGLVFGLIILARSWNMLPDIVPTHFGISGAPDAWGAKTSLLLLPGIGILIYLSITILGRFPGLYNYPVTITETNYMIQYYLARSLMAWLKTEIIWLFLWLNWLTIQTSLGHATGLGWAAMPIILIVTIVTIVVYFQQAFQAR